MNLSDLCTRHNLKPTGILHVGASMLEEAGEYEAMQVPVIWVEALPKSEEREARSTKYKQLLYEGLALSDKEEPVTLSIASNLVSSSILPFHRHSLLYPDIIVTKRVQMKSRRPDKFFGDKFPKEINTLVLDAQGADLSVIKGMGWLLDQIDQVVCEVFLTELYAGAPLKPEVVRYMASRGFRLAEFEEVHIGEWGNALFTRKSRDSAIEAAMKVPGLITQEELAILMRLALQVTTRVVVETGTYKGRTATLFASLGATVFTIDDYSGRWAKQDAPGGLGDVQTDERQLWEAVAGLHTFASEGRIFQMIANTHTQMKELETVFSFLFRSRKADFVFLDGNHSYECVSAELKLAEAITVPGGIISGHDLDFLDTVGKALQESRGDKYHKLSDKLWCYTKEA